MYKNEIFVCKFCIRFWILAVSGFPGKSQLDYTQIEKKASGIRPTKFVDRGCELMIDNFLFSISRFKFFYLHFYGTFS